jgi:hypothetical protein
MIRSKNLRASSAVAGAASFRVMTFSVSWTTWKLMQARPLSSPTPTSDSATPRFRVSASSNR